MSRSNSDLNSSRDFGRHIRACRRARGLTQETLAEQSGLSPDTIRRLEHGSFSPSLSTLMKVSTGLKLTLSTLFEAFEFNERNISREIGDLILLMKPRERLVVLRLLPMLRDLLRLDDDEE